MEEANSGKFIKRFTIKLILWFILIDIVIGGAVLVANVAGWGDIENDYEATGEAVKTFLNSIIVVNIVAIVASPLLALKSAKKKCKITEENKKSIFKGIVIATAILAVVMAVVHIGIKNVIVEAVTDGSDFEWSDIKKAVKDSEEFLEDNDFGMAQDDLEAMVDMVKVFYGRVNIYGMDWLVFIVMIGVEYYLIVKKEQEA